MAVEWAFQPVRVSVALAAGVIFLASCGDKGDPTPPSAPEPPINPSAEILPAIPGFDPSAFDGKAGELMGKADPADDAQAWDTEALSADAQAQLKALAKLLEQAAAADAAPLLDGDFAATGLPAPGELRQAYSDASSEIARAPDDVPAPALDARRFFSRLMGPHAAQAGVRVSLKIYQIEVVGDGFDTTVLFQSSSGGGIQQNAVWNCRWSGESPPRLRSVAVSGFELARSGLRFVDATGAVFGGCEPFRQQMGIGAGYWADRLQKFYLIDSTAHQGIAIGDADGDGLEDLYVAQQGGLPNRLYLRDHDGTLRDVSAQAGVDWMELSHGVLFVDLDDDADQDLVIAQSQQLLIMENLGGLKFEVRVRYPAGASYLSVAASDYDGDGDLDLFACGYSRQGRDEYAEGARVSVPIPYHDSHNGGSNLLLRNGGGWAFTDVADASGMGVDNDRHSFAAAWEDYDNDGDPDLYVANDFGRNNLYRNDGGKFVDVAAAAGVEDLSAGMGVTWGDYDRDGRMDLYVSNMFSAAGNRVAYQRQFRPGADAATLAGFQRHARGNSLFQNGAGGSFTDVSVAAGVTMGRWAWGAKFADLNNDGWEDLYVANGYISSAAKDDL